MLDEKERKEQEEKEKQRRKNAYIEQLRTLGRSNEIGVLS